MVRFRQEHRGTHRDAIDAIAIPLYEDGRLVAVPTKQGHGVAAGGYVPAGWAQPEGLALLLVAFEAFAGFVDGDGRPSGEAVPVIRERDIVSCTPFPEWNGLPDRAAGACVEIALDDMAARFEAMREARGGVLH